MRIYPAIATLLEQAIRIDNTTEKSAGYIFRKIEAICREHMPSGSGFDNGSKLNIGKSTPDKLIFDTAFHHMNEQGVYAGWTHHAVVVRSSMVGGYGVSVVVKGRNSNQIKEHIEEAFSFVEEIDLGDDWHAWPDRD
jgi:hypothetical protein